MNRILRQIILCIVIAILAILSLAGCNKKPTSPTTDKLITVTDCVGRKVEVPVGSQRIAAPDAFAAEAMVMCGAGKQLCACPNRMRTDVILQKIYPKLSKVPTTSSNGAVNVETLTQIGAEVAIIKQEMYEAGTETIKFDKMRIPYVVIGYETMEDQIKALKLIGEICAGKPAEKMKQITDYYEQTIGLCENLAAGIPEDQRIRVYHSINSVERTDGQKSVGTDWIRTVGAVNVSADLDQAVEGHDYQAGLEQIYAWDPDVVICNAADTTDYMYTDSKWKGLRAVREKQVKTVPVGATRWGQRGGVETFFAMIWLGSEIYPDEYAGIDLKKEVKIFYKDVLGVEVDDQLYEEILSGRGVRQAGTNVGGGNGNGN